MHSIPDLTAVIPARPDNFFTMHASRIQFLYQNNLEKAAGSESYNFRFETGSLFSIFRIISFPPGIISLRP